MYQLTSSPYQLSYSTNLSLKLTCTHLPLVSGLSCDRRPDPTTFTSMDPRHQTPADVLEELVNTLRTSLTQSLLLLLPLEVPWPCLLPTHVMQLSGAASLLQVALFLEMQPQRFLTGRSKVAFLISLLTGKALLWDRAIWNANSLVINSYDAFINHFKGGV